MSSVTEPAEVVWQATIDGRAWLATVVATGEAEAVLTVRRVSDEHEILRENVGLTFGAIFGPDVSDVQMWSVMIVEAIDKFNAEGNQQ